jgi:hypothetical protein
MAAPTAPRFKSREAALRLYFRASELLTPNAKPGVFSAQRPPRIQSGPNLIHDFFILDSCFCGLNDVQLWLLRELYGPTGFDAKPRPLAELFEAARRKFPGRVPTPQRFAQFRHEALKIFEAHLQRERMI